jgi:alkanesulfonate monooxygenase SsuD/methylene tetrahydromethanopterin reductase-like flavin-dependent oxidoreductase (luciferase family)
VNVGLYFDLRNPPPWQRPWTDVYGFALELCEEADRNGVHSLWFSEHHLFEDGYLPQPLTFAAAVAARTTQARLGTSIMIAGLRPAADIAEQAAVVDIVSNGRVELGLGAGYRPPEFALYGVDGSRPHALLYRRVEELRRLWAEGRVTPPPVQERIPIWLGVAGPRGARRAGELGEGLMRISRQLTAPYEEGLAAGGHGPEARRLCGPVNVLLSDDPERDWPLVREHVAWQWDSYARHRVEGTDEPAPPPIDPDALRARGIDRGVLNGFAVLTPEDAAEAIRAAAEGLDAETAFLWATVSGMPDAIAVRHAELTVERLAPLLASA